MQPYMVFYDEDYAYVKQGAYLIDKKEVENMIAGLQNFLKIYSQEKIDETNKKIETNIYKEWNDIENEPKEKKVVVSGLYLMESKNKYKIGVSKNVERRLKELNNRPFETKLIAHKNNVENAYDIEEKLHFKYQNKRLGGEWFELNEKEVDEVVSFINNLKGVEISGS